MTEQTPESQPSGQQAPTPTPPPTQAPAKQPPWGDKPENFDPDKAWELIQNLRNERKAPDPQLRSELETLRAQQEAQREAFAKALGLKPEETSDTERLTQQLNDLREQVTNSQHQARLLSVADEFKIPGEFRHLLTERDPDKLKAQAESLVKFAEAAHVAATPAFQPNPGQGQGNAPLSPEAAEFAEYQQFYPPVTR